MTLPFIAALMPTYGRASRQPELIRLAVKDFVEQDYPDDRRLLIVLNDAAGHVVTCDHPRVWCVNMGERASSLGTKCNILTALAKLKGAELGMPWEDDDRSLPHRMRLSALKMEGGYEYWNPGLVWFHQREAGPKLDGVGVMHHASCFRIASFFGKYQDTSKGHDMAADSWARANLRCQPYKIPQERPQEVFYTYTWGFSDFHLSGQHDMNAAYASANPGPPGAFKIAVVASPAGG